MSSTQPKVSILIPCYNAEKWIGSCIESALLQSYPNTEVCLVDDGSVDKSLEIAKGYETKGLKVFEQKNLGGNVARARLCREASGEWLQYLDADDWLGPQKVQQQMDVLAITDQQPDVLFGEVIYAWMNGDKIESENHSSRTHVDVFEALLTWELPQTGGPLLSKEAVLDVGNWKEDQPCCQEHELYSRLLMSGKNFMYTGKTTAFYRQWSDQTVCKKDVSLVHRKRLEIMFRVWDTLEKEGSVTTGRLNAMSQALFELARSIWQYDQEKALELIKWIRSNNKGFIPSGPAAPKQFLLIQKLFGFAAAEKIAAYLR